MVDGGIERELGGLGARMEAMEKAMEGVALDVRGMRDQMNKIKGGWTVIGIASAIAGSIGALATKALPFFVLAVK